MPSRALHPRAIAHAVAVCAVFLLVADPAGAHIHPEEECLPCVIAEADATPDTTTTSIRPTFHNPQPPTAKTATAKAPSPRAQSRAPPPLP